MSDMIEIKKEKHDDPCCVSSDSHYPYGTRLTLTNEMVEQLGLSQLAVGDEVMIHAEAYVDSRSEHESESKDGEGYSEKQVCFQLTAIKVKRNDSTDRVETLYGKS